MANHYPAAAGKSSYDLVDETRLWRHLALSPDTTVLDLGCGAGRYALPMAARVGPRGLVIAVDLWLEGIAGLKQTAIRDNITNLDPRVADAGGPLPLDDQCVDICLLATVLHEFVQAGIAPQALQEVVRVLKPQGRIAVVEFKKEESPNGPPRSIRLAVEDLSVLVQHLGLIRCSGVVDLGPDLYLTQFKRLPPVRRL